SLLAEKEQDEPALAEFQRALEFQPDYPEAHNGIGHILDERGDVPGALASYREAIRSKPDFAPAWVNLGQLHAKLGDLDQAQECFREALGRHPGHIGAYVALANLSRGRLPDEDVTAIEQLLHEGRRSLGNRASLHEALLQVCDARGDYAQAAEHAREVN